MQTKEGGEGSNTLMSSSPASLFPSFPSADQQQHRLLIHLAIQRVLDSGCFILGEEVAAFEGEFAAFLGVKHVVGVGSGTDAIELMLRALEIGPGSAVIVPSFAPSAVAAGVMRSGAEPVFADIESDTLTPCPQSLDAVLRSVAGMNVKAALAVHLGGHPAEWELLQRVADEHGIVLLEDCAQAHGALWRGKMTGSLGAAAAFSFYPTKNLAALGDAGAVATNNAGLAERLRLIRQYGWRQRYISETAGVNSRLDELQAAVLRAKLPFLQESVRRRRELAARYDERLKRVGIVTVPKVRSSCAHAYHQYLVRSKRRDELVLQLQQAGIPVAVPCPAPLHWQPAYGGTAVLPESDRASAEIVSLPLHPHLSDDAVDLVCAAIERLNHAAC